MIYKPSPWFNENVGGYGYRIKRYYQKPTKLMRIIDNELHDRAIRYADLGKTY